MNELKPCSHCGSRDLYKIEIKDNLQITQPAIFCNTCKTVLSVEDDSHTFDDDERMKYLEHKVRKAWNRRPAPENKPLTLDQLRQMDGEPVWVCGIPDHEIKWTPGWRIINGNRVALRRWNDAVMYLYFADYGRTWLAYARKPEKEEDHA